MSEVKLACVYSAIHPMRVVSYEERERLISTGEWFRHPNDIVRKPIDEELSYEEQIRRGTRKRFGFGKKSPESI